ncbi:MAG: CDP-alcohol phosphatidyltransferase [Chitinophagaceae bacterium]|nr:CDP-alcohol phosphatidyltransferase [Chitinophagaceae bacterium]
MKKKIPVVLIYCRVLVGFLLIILSTLKIPHYNVWAVSFLTLGLLTDVLDGIVARLLNISTEKLRRMDSTADQVFFVCVAIATYIQCPNFFREHHIKLLILGGSEVLIYVTSFIKFRKEVATHSLGAKLWTLFLFATLVQVIIQCHSPLIFNLCFWIGIITRIEIICILLILKVWATDVPTVYDAFQLRRNKKIKRYKMFNG